MTLILRLSRASRLPATSQTSIYHRPALQAQTSRYLTPLLSLLQARTATGYSGARKPNPLWKQSTHTSGSSHNPGREGLKNSGRRDGKGSNFQESQTSERGRASDRHTSKPHPGPLWDKNDPIEVKMSKTLSWILRHGAAYEGLAMREDGFVYVSDLLKLRQLRKLIFTLPRLKEIVKNDPKQRFSLLFEQVDGPRLNYITAEENAEGKGVWLVRASQGHSISSVKIEFKPILHVSDIPSGIAVHGTTYSAWCTIQNQGLSKMERNHIHLAQAVGERDVISGMRRSSDILIFINVEKALAAGINFYLSDNGVVLTEGNERGFLSPEFFESIFDVKERREEQKKAKRRMAREMERMRKRKS